MRKEKRFTVTHINLMLNRWMRNAHRRLHHGLFCWQKPPLRRKNARFNNNPTYISFMSSRIARAIKRAKQSMKTCTWPNCYSTEMPRDWSAEHCQKPSVLTPPPGTNCCNALCIRLGTFISMTSRIHMCKTTHASWETWCFVRDHTCTALHVIATSIATSKSIGIWIGR